MDKAYSKDAADMSAQVGSDLAETIQVTPWAGHDARAASEGEERTPKRRRQETVDAATRLSTTSNTTLSQVVIQKDTVDDNSTTQEFGGKDDVLGSDERTKLFEDPSTCFYWLAVEEPHGIIAHFQGNACLTSPKNAASLKKLVRNDFSKELEGIDIGSIQVHSHEGTPISSETIWNPESHGGTAAMNALIITGNRYVGEAKLVNGECFLFRPSTFDTETVY
jgi:hypothetical protein